VPNWLYLFFNSLYHLGLGLWIGGAVVITFHVSPAILAALPRFQAFVIQAAILRRFARLRLLALLMILIGAGAKFLIWERFDIAPWLAIRWGAIVALAWALIFDLNRTRRLLAFGKGIELDAAVDDPRRMLFELLYIRAEGLMRASVLAAFIALLFS
jgi:uncharacterized membrane protein